MRKLTLGKDLVVIRHMKAWDRNLRQSTASAAQGLPVYVYLAATSGEGAETIPAPFHPSLQVTLTETTVDGDYDGTLEGSLTRANAMGLRGKVAYLITRISGVEDYLDFEPVLVVGNSLVQGADL